MDRHRQFAMIESTVKHKAVDIYLEFLRCVNLFIDHDGFDKHPHITKEVLNCITEDLTQAYQDVCESNDRTFIFSLKEMVALIDLYTPAFTIIRSYGNM